MTTKKQGVLKSGFAPNNPAPLVPQDNSGRLFTAALLQAAQGKCDCPGCQILRQIATGLTSQLMTEVGDGGH